MYKAFIDADYIKYTAASTGEKRTVVVTHKTTGDQWSFKNRTEFWGNHQNKCGGFLEVLNKGRDSPYFWDEFQISDIQTPDRIENILHTAKSMYERCYKSIGAYQHKGYIGKGDSFRVERSTILKYKDNRKDLLKPVHIEDVTEYLIKRFKCEVVTGLETDDRVVIEAFSNKKNGVVVGVDKDYYGQPCLFLNINKIEDGVINCNNFGSLKINTKNKVEGFGRLFLYYQVLSGDYSDNYFANSASDVRWGDKAAFNALCECKNDKEAFEALVTSYKYLYPTPKEAIGWRGDKILIDWKYVLTENFDLARMLRWEGDIVNLDTVLEKYDLLNNEG